jgi:hypothetical protein
MTGIIRNPLLMSWLKYSRNSARQPSEAANGPACGARSNPAGFSSSSYTPKQLEYATGGPKQRENLYTSAMLEREFGDLRHLTIVEEERELREGASHAGMSAVIGLTARKR